MPANPKDIEFLLKDLARGQVSLPDVERILQAATAARNAHQLSTMKSTMSGKLKAYDDFESQMLEFISEWWEDDEVDAWKESLLALAQGADPSRVDEIMEIAGDASNARNELQNMSDEEEEYGEIESGMEEDIGKAIDLLKAYWSTHVAKKSPAPKARKRR